MIDNNVKINIFIQFLKDNNVYDELMKLSMSQKNTTNIKELLSSGIDDCYVVYIFNWSKHIDGYGFFAKINKKWQDQKEDYYKQYKRNDLIDKIL